MTALKRKLFTHSVRRCFSKIIAIKASVLSCTPAAASGSKTFEIKVRCEVEGEVTIVSQLRKPMMNFLVLSLLLCCVRACARVCVCARLSGTRGNRRWSLAQTAVA